MDDKKAKLRNNTSNIKKSIKIEKLQLPIKLSLNELKVVLTLEGISTTVVNTLRRIMLSEFTVNYLWSDKFEITSDYDPFMPKEFVLRNIANIPLKSNLEEKNAVYKLHVINNTPVNKKVYSGDIKRVDGGKEVQFNETFQIAELSPGKSLIINEIKILTKTGGKVIQCGFTHTDLEKFSQDELNSSTALINRHGAELKISDLSHYKESTLIADPSSHIMTFYIPAAGHENEAKIVLNDAIDNILERLQKLESVLGDFKSIEIGDKLLELNIKLEDTATMGELLKKTIFDVTLNKIELYKYEQIQHICNITVRHNSNPTELMQSVIDKCKEIFRALKV